MAAASKDTKDVRVVDEEGVKRVFQPRVLTRAAKRELREALVALSAFQEELPENPLEVSGEQEDRATRLMCDVINVGTKAPEDVTPAGDLLYEQWMAEAVADDDIIAAFETVTGTGADPT